MRRITRSRLIKIVGVLVIVVCGLVMLMAVLGPHFEIVYPLAGYIKGNPEYCTHQLTDDRQIRLAFTPYAKREQVNGHQIDPNNWQHERFAHDFLPHLIIVIPYVDYEITQDGGVSWKGFWHYENQINEWAWCEAFSSLDADNFWIWTRSQIAVTHDGGNTWIVQDGYKEWNTGGNMTIKEVIFNTPDNGQIIFINWSNVPDPTLLTNDGGKTWHLDPNWIPSNE